MFKILYIIYTHNDIPYKGKLAQFANMIHHRSHLLNLSLSQNRHYIEEYALATVQN